MFFTIYNFDGGVEIFKRLNGCVLALKVKVGVSGVVTLSVARIATGSRIYAVKG